MTQYEATIETLASLPPKRDTSGDFATLTAARGHAKFLTSTLTTGSYGIFTDYSDDLDVPVYVLRYEPVTGERYYGNAIEVYQDGLRII